MKENNNTFIVAVIAALLVGGLTGYSLKSLQHMSPHSDMSGMHINNNSEAGMHSMSDGSMMGHDDMVSHMNMMVSSERSFIEGMIPHHQEAIDTAREVLERGGTTPDVRLLAEEIIAAQDTEINMMKQWYQSWYGETYENGDDYIPMMRSLTQLSGVELDKTFLEDMVMHHMGAIMMARSVQPYIENTEMENLTEAIIVTQSAEIQQMQNILRGL